MRIRTCLVCSTVCFFLLLGGLQAQAGQGLIEDLGPAYLDWRTKTLTAIGEVEPPGQAVGNAGKSKSSGLLARQAKMRARQALWQGLQKVRVDDTRTVGDIVKADPDKRQTLRELVHAAPLKPGSAQDGLAVSCKATLSLTGKILSECIPSNVWYEDYEPAAYAESSMPQGPEIKITGLIVDARGLGGKPALTCRLFDGQERLVHGPSLMSREIGQARGVVGYRSSVQEAKASSRVGGSPLIVRARRLHRESLTDFIVALEDVQPLWLSGSFDVLRDGKVIVVLQEESGARVVEYPVDE